MLNLNSLMIGTNQVKVMADFYEKVFERTADMTEDEWYGWQVGDCFFSVGTHSEMTGSAKESGRVLFNFETTEVQAEFERLKSFGAKVVKEPYQMGEGWIATLADPDGNYFQFMTPWESEA